VAVLELPSAPDPELAYRELFAAEPCRFWLDSGGRGRFSYLGTGTEHVRHRAADGTVTVTGPEGVRRVRQPFLAYLDEQLRRRQAPAPAGLPFAFTLGYVGYLGYELKAETGGVAAHEASTPDAALVLADRMLAVDHRDGRAWLLTQSTVDDSWLHRAAVRLEAHARAGRPAAEEDPGALVDATEVPWLVPRHDREDYLDRVRACLAAIAAGDSYELCLTNELAAEVDLDPTATYAALRRISPVPYGALLELPGLAVLSASPECFLSVGADRVVESRPIKGTRPRGRTPAEDEALRRDLATSAKDRAENVMIVDLVRNDLGRVCQVGSMRVPQLCEVETYPPVHQLVSTVRGTLRPELSTVDAVRAAFPPGSMTGAPKVATMAILDRLEGGPRGVYSGALGWFSLAGPAELSVVIRTLVATPGRVSFGVGGAVVADSDPAAEHAETMVKSRAMTTALLRSTRAGSASAGTPGW
jgi:para-aminobenzoate synthetase